MSDPGFNKAMTRAQVLKSGMAAIGAISAGGLLQACGGGGSNNTKKSVKPPKMVNGKLDFGGVEIKAIGDEFTGPIWQWYADDLEKEANVKIADPAKFAFGTESQAITPKLITHSQPPFNVVSYAAWFIGDFVATGGLEPLEPYLRNLPGYAQYNAGVMPVYRELYAKSKGQVYALMADGDSFAFHYRKSYFANPTLQKAYRKQFNRDLAAPKTWDEYVELATFLTNQLKGDNIYGTQYATEPAVSWAYWLNTAGSLGMRYFDANMNPTVNSAAGVKGLEILLRLAEVSPPGVENFSNDDTISNWASGKVISMPWWQDLTEVPSKISQDDSVDTILPGSPGPDGKIKVASALAFSRMFSVPSNQPDDVKQAAVWAAYRMSHPDYSLYSVTDPYDGLEPYHAAHLTRKAVVQFTKPNPKRGTAKDYPKNNGIYRSVARAQNHVNAIRGSIQNGYPQPQWPGAGEYLRVLGTEIGSATAGQKTAKKALDDVAAQWSDIVDKRGRDEQKAFYAQFLKSAQRLGL